MARKIILDVDPGIDDAVAMCLALGDPSLEVLAVTATGGTVSPEQSTINVQAIVEQLDPPRWPRLGHCFDRSNSAQRRAASVRLGRPVRCPLRRRPAASSAPVGEGDLRRSARCARRRDDRRDGPALEHRCRAAAAARSGVADRPLDHAGRHVGWPGQRDGRRRVQYLLRRRRGPHRVSFAGHQDAHSDRPNAAASR